jgi:rhodanese-related sulfurtransferase
MMIKRILSTTIALLLLAACSQAPAPSTSGETASSDDHAAFKQLTPDQVEQLMNAGSALTFDANGADTRAEYGVVPGAALLTSYKAYDVGKELPTDKAKQIVFYCANTYCSAAPTAAQRAKEAGFTNVAVMPEGIQGWVKAGKAVNRPEVG